MDATKFSVVSMTLGVRLSHAELRHIPLSSLWGERGICKTVEIEKK